MTAPEQQLRAHDFLVNNSNMGRVTLRHKPCAYALHLTIDESGYIVLWCAWCSLVVATLTDVELV